MLLNIPRRFFPRSWSRHCAKWGTEINPAGGRPLSRACERCHATFLRADGIGVPALLEAILTLMPLDAYTDEPAMVMDVDVRQGQIPIHDTYRAIVAAHDPRKEAAVSQYERYAFYGKADTCAVIVQTGEEAVYANIILQKGVIK